MSDNHERNSMYKHNNRQEMLAFVEGRMLAAVINTKNDELTEFFTTGTLASGDAGAMDKCNAALFALLIVRIDNTELVGTLAVQYSKKGKEAIHTSGSHSTKVIPTTT